MRSSVNTHNHTIEKCVARNWSHLFSVCSPTCHCCAFKPRPQFYAPISCEGRKHPRHQPSPATFRMLIHQSRDWHPSACPMRLLHVNPFRIGLFHCQAIRPAVPCLLPYRQTTNPRYCPVTYLQALEPKPSINHHPPLIAGCRQENTK